MHLYTSLFYLSNRMFNKRGVSRFILNLVFLTMVLLDLYRL